MERVKNGAMSGFDDVDERDEIMRLTEMAKSWEFTCSFCFKKFPSAQAMGGHQNAHRNERLQEKRLFVKDPISFRKRNYVKAIKKAAAAAAAAGGGLGGVNNVNVAEQGGVNGVNSGAPPPPVDDAASMVMRDFMRVEEQEAGVGVGVAAGMIGDSKGTSTTAQSDSVHEMNVDLTLKL